MKFDFAIGNPPYQEDRQGNSNTALPVYHQFMEAAYSVSNATELITPARFLFNAGRTPKDWNQKMLRDEHFKVMEYVLDAFQGRENDIIMYSTVRTDNSIGFQKEKERVNVAFSRAKKLLIICGDLNFFYNYNDPNNKFIEIIDYIRTHDHCKIISCKGGNLF